jgi:ABC-type sugar transport system permease subunit
MKDLESRENKRVEQQNLLVKKIEETTSNFNNTSNDLHVKYKSVANAYLEKINTDNQEQDFQKALDNKFEKIDNNTKILMNGIIKSNEQTKKEVQEYKKTLEGKFQDNDKLIGKYNKSLNQMNKGIFSLFLVVFMVALISIITGPIGDILMLNHYAETIHDQIVQGESIWRYFFYLLYIIPYAILGLILFVCMKSIEALNDKF